MNVWEYFKFVTSRRDCEKRVVTPLDAALNQLKNVIVVPFEAVGTGVGRFANQLWQNLPFPWNVLIFPLTLIFVAGTTFLLVLAFRDAPFRLNLMHLLHLEIGGAAPPRPDDEDEFGKNLERLLAHRKMIEEAETSPSKKKKKKMMIEDVETSSPKNKKMMIEEAETSPKKKMEEAETSLSKKKKNEEEGSGRGEKLEEKEERESGKGNKKKKRGVFGDRKSDLEL